MPIDAIRTPQFVRFLFAGLLNTAFGYVAFVALLWIGLPSGYALVGATTAGIAFNFQTSRRMVFGGQAGAFAKFALLYGALFLINWVALSSLERIGVPSWVGQAALTLPLALLSFCMQRLIVFPQPRTP